MHISTDPHYVVPSLSDIIHFFINTTALLFALLSIIKFVFYVIKRKLIRSHRLNLLISVIPAALLLVIVGPRQFESFLGYSDLMSSLLYFVLIPSVIVYVAGYLLMETTDIILFLPKRARLIWAVILAVLVIYLYPKTINVRSRYFGIIDSGFSVSCRCAGPLVDEKLCFGIPFSCKPLEY